MLNGRRAAGASFRDFVELSKRDVSSRLAGAFDDVGFTVPWARDHLYPGRFARSVASWCRDYALHGVAFLPLNFSALQRAEASIRALVRQPLSIIISCFEGSEESH